MRVTEKGKIEPVRKSTQSREGGRKEKWSEKEKR